ncbi:MAG: GAF domain-containing protein [Actinobacteria bacterium]|nr:GAF domain-containing protein [Actinomycetota bacterium]
MRRLVGRAHELFVTGVVGGVDNVRGVVLDSWHRSASHGIDPTVAAPPQVLSSNDLAGVRDASPLSAVMPLVRDLLADTVTESGNVVAVGDADGRLLWVEGDSRRRSEVEAMGFAEGTLWSEAAIGTNAPGTALELDRPVQIFAAEHFVSSVQSWSCTAVPVHDLRSGSVLGVVDVTGDDHTVSSQALALVRATVAAAEATLVAVRYRPDGTVRLDGSDRTAEPWRLEVLGRAGAELHGDVGTRTLSTRHSELMLLLALHPRGLTTDQLATLLHHDEVPAVTIRAELTRLRRLLGPDELLSRPYRLARSVDTDLKDVLDLLAEGQLREAVGRYPGPLLPQSEAPAIAELRYDTAMRVKRAALASGDVSTLLRFATTPDGRSDVEVLSAVLPLLPAGSPRRPAVEARIAVLNHLLG